MKPRGRVSLADQKRANALAMRAMAISSPKELTQEAIDLATPVPIKVRAKRSQSAINRPRETPLKWEICKAVKTHPNVAWASVFNRGMAREGNRRVPYNYQKGFSDIAGQMKDGRFIALEVKRDAKGDITADQMTFINTVKVYGGVAGIVWTVAMALEILDAA